MRSLTLCWLAAVTGTSAGCLSTEAPNTDDYIAGVVEGQVTRTDGSPVGGPFVVVSLLSAPQGGSVLVLAQTQVLASDQGRFSVTFLVPGQPQQGSTAIHVERPIGSGLLSRDTMGIAVVLGRDFPPRDTTHVQIALRPVGGSSEIR
jgi:hypothetical protein